MDRELLEKVCHTPGIPGYEDAIQDVVQEILADVCNEVSCDRMGNVIGLKRGTTPPSKSERALRVVLAAHSDEIGMMVKHIDADGFIGFQPVGGLNPQAIVSQRVIIHCESPVNGVIVPRRNGLPLPTLDEMLIDVGRPRDAVCAVIEVGDVITFAEELADLNDQVYVGRNFDDRIGTYCMLEAMKQVGPTAVDVYAVSTVQEELGVRGAYRCICHRTRHRPCVGRQRHLRGPYIETGIDLRDGKRHGYLYHGSSDNGQSATGSFSLQSV